jgi:TM2 domain-containing membrane protein YozV
MTRRTILIVRGVMHLIASAIFGVIGADLVGQGGTGWTIVGVWCSILAVIALALGFLWLAIAARATLRRL